MNVIQSVFEKLSHPCYNALSSMEIWHIPIKFWDLKYWEHFHPTNSLQHSRNFYRDEHSLNSPTSTMHHRFVCMRVVHKLRCAFESRTLEASNAMSTNILGCVVVFTQRVKYQWYITPWRAGQLKSIQTLSFTENY